MKRRSLPGVVLVFGVCAVGHSSDGSAQSADVLAVSAWRLHFEYTVKSSINTAKQQVDYQVKATGDGVLERDPNGASTLNFRGAPTINVQLSYTGSVIDDKGCGLMESLHSTGAAICNPQTNLHLNDDGTFELELGCGRVPVAHTFTWQGPCGQLFEYPVDGATITDWGWQVQDAAFGSMPRVTFALPKQGTALSGSDAGAPTGLISSLFTAIATGATTPVAYTFDFTLNPAAQEDLTLELDSPSYDTWRPSTTASGDPGEPLLVTARLKSSTGRDPGVRVTDFVWKLTGTSREPGLAMNFPVNAADTALDLRLGTPEDTHTFDADRQQGERFNPDGFTDTMAVVPSDWGGWSTLSVTAILSDGRRIVGKLPGASEDGARLPKRSATSLIADFWKQSRRAGNKADGDDDETTPAGDQARGDGLNLYQEYRGFYGGGEHREGDPLVKDLFVLNRARGLATAGLAQFKRLSKVNLQPWLREDELPESRVINGNRGAAPAGSPQHAVIVAVDQSLRGLSRAEGGPGNPGKISWVRLQGDWFTVKANAWTSIVAHELFHCVNVAHHGEADRQKVVWRVSEPDQLIEEAGGPGTGTQIQVHQEDGADFTADVIASLRASATPGVRNVWIGVDQGQHSGDDHCVMRYFNANAYVKRADPTVRIDATDYPGTALCRSPSGTGVNADGWQPQPRYGAAAEGRGNCEHQVHVTDAIAAPAH